MNESLGYFLELTLERGRSVKGKIGNQEQPLALDINPLLISGGHSLEIA